MIKTSIEKLAEEIGFDIANSDDETQAKLLNGFCKGLSNSMDERHLQMQISYIVDKLNPKTSRILKEIVQFLELKEKEN